MCLKIRKKFVALLIAFTVLPALVNANVFSPFSGFADISLLDTKTDGLYQENFKQEYNVRFGRNLTQWTSIRASIRHFKFNQEIDQVLGFYKEELQPTGEFRWNHPNLNFNTSYQKRKVTTANNQGIVTDTFRSSLKSTNRNWPLLTIQYNNQKSVNENDPQIRDITNKQLLTSVNYQTDLHQYLYSFNHRISENIVSNLESTSDNHNFRWQASGNPGQSNRLKFSGNYNFTYRLQQNIVHDSSPVLEFITPVTGLYAYNINPEFGPLEIHEELIDGNSEDPAMPLIDIGGSATGHNIGGEFTGPESLGAIYIYTDRPSGAQVIWEVYGSIDNESWVRVESSIFQSFNSSVNRYELEFTPESFRYFKVINTGFNEIAQVNLTEIKFLRIDEAFLADITKSSTLSHTVDGRVSYDINDSWKTSMDVSLDQYEVPGIDNDRTRSALGWNINFTPDDIVSHGFKINGFRQADDRLESNLNEAAMVYSLLVKPNQDSRGTFSLSNSMDWQDDIKSQEIRSASVNGRTELIQGMSLSLGSTVSRNRDFISERDLRAFSVRSSCDAELLENLDINLDAIFNESSEKDSDYISSRLNEGIGVKWRVTPAVFLRSSLRHNRYNSDKITIDFLLSWNIIKKLRLSVQHYELSDDFNTTTLRRSINANWDIGLKSRYYARWAEVNLSGGGGAATTSFQQGLRIGF